MGYQIHVWVPYMGHLTTTINQNGQLQNQKYKQSKRIWTIICCSQKVIMVQILIGILKKIVSFAVDMVVDCKVIVNQEVDHISLPMGKLSDLTPINVMFLSDVPSLSQYMMWWLWTWTWMWTWTWNPLYQASKELKLGQICWRCSIRLLVVIEM